MLQRSTGDPGEVKHKMKHVEVWMKEGVVGCVAIYKGECMQRRETTDIPRTKMFVQGVWLL